MARAYAFPRSHRLCSRAEFSAVFDAKVRESRGPVMVYCRPNALDHPRLGLSTSRKVGTAVRRNRIRRLLREAFRHLQHDLPAGYDIVIVVRAHDPLQLAEYQRLLSVIMMKLHASWQRRSSPEK